LQQSVLLQRAGTHFVLFEMNAAGAGSIWSWQANDGSFVPYDPKSLQLIDEAWKSGKNVVDVRPGCLYRVDLVQKQQQCIDSTHQHETTHRIRAVRGPSVRPPQIVTPNTESARRETITTTTTRSAAEKQAFFDTHEKQRVASSTTTSASMAFVGVDLLAEFEKNNARHHQNKYQVLTAIESSKPNHGEIDKQQHHQQRQQLQQHQEYEQQQQQQQQQQLQQHQEHEQQKQQTLERVDLPITDEI
jgi:hypothetical protein